MKRKNNKIKLFFAMIVMCFAAIFTFKTLPNLRVSSFASSQTQINQNVEYKEVNKNILSVEIPSLTTTFKELSTGTDITSTFENTYTGSEFELSLTATSTDATNFTYQWQYSKDGGEFTAVEGETNSSIKLKDCNQSGYYNCVITNADDTTQVSTTQNINFVINQKEISINSLSLKETTKVYDGTNTVSLNATYSGVVEGDTVVVEVLGKTATSNADLKKVVEFDCANLSGEDAGNYVVSSTLPQSQLVIDVTKAPATVVWQTLDNKTSYVYNTKDQIGNISAFYNSVSGEKIKLAFTITGYHTNGTTRHYANEFFNVGTYKAVASLSDKEVNYELTNLELSLTITRATPTLTISNTVFTYTGSEQNASRCVTINNQEQDLVFTNNYFTTVTEGNGRQVTVYAEQSLNYFEITKTFAINVVKADATIDVSSIKKEYVYNGDKQTINTGAVIDNAEQTLVYTNNTFTSVADGNGKKVTVYALATENYNYVSETFTISVDKATIDTSKWSWYYPNDFTYTGNAQTVRIINHNPTLVTPVYTGATQTNVGTYTANVRFDLNEPENYNEISFPGLTWKIKKAPVSKPNCQFRTTVYTGSEQTLEVPTNGKYSVSNNTYTNAGVYYVSIALKDNYNYQWEDSSVENLSIKWIIQKAEVAVPQVDKQYTYTGKTLDLGLEENELYTVVGGSATEVGKYTTTLILKDPANYQWANSESAVLTINWEILEQQKDSTLPIIAILISFVTIILIAVYATLHSTKVIKHRRKRQRAKEELEKQRKLNKAQEEAKLKAEKEEVLKAKVEQKETDKTLAKPQQKLTEEEPKKDVKTVKVSDKKEEIKTEKVEGKQPVKKQETVEKVEEKKSSKTTTEKAKTGRKTRATTKKKKVVAKKRNDARKKATEIKRAAEKKVQTKQKVKAKKAKELEKAKEAKKKASQQAKAKAAKAKEKAKATAKKTTKTSTKTQTKK
ncbi:MAG: hypothetical protein IJW32_01100 [Clostridia bacterium]|nr:hypothetical protein [Clostridia bacterium]